MLVKLGARERVTDLQCSKSVYFNFIGFQLTTYQVIGAFISVHCVNLCICLIQYSSRSCSLFMQLKRTSFSLFFSILELLTVIARMSFGHKAADFKAQLHGIGSRSIRIALNKMHESRTYIRLDIQCVKKSP